MMFRARVYCGVIVEVLTFVGGQSLLAGSSALAGVR